MTAQPFLHLRPETTIRHLTSAVQTHAALQALYALAVSTGVAEELETMKQARIAIEAVEGAK